MNRVAPNASAKKKNETRRSVCWYVGPDDISKLLQRVLSLRGRHIGTSRCTWRGTKVLQSRLVHEGSLLSLLVLLLLRLALVQDAER